MLFILYNIIIHTASLPMMSSTQESTLCRKYGLIPAKTPTGSYLIWQGWVYSKTFNVGTSSGETGESSSGRMTLFRMYNLSPRKHYSSIKQGRILV